MLATCEVAGNHEGKGIPGRIECLQKRGGKATCDTWRSMSNFACRRVGFEEKLEKKQ